MRIYNHEESRGLLVCSLCNLQMAAFGKLKFYLALSLLFLIVNMLQA